MKWMNRTVLAVLVVLGLTACGGASDVSPTLANVPTEAGTPIADVPLPTNTDGSQPLSSEVMTRAAAIADGSDPLAGIPPYGELVASSTEDVNAGLVFDSIQLTRYGGGEGFQAIQITILQNGSYIRNGVTGNLSPAEVTNLDTMLDEINFFGLQSVMMSVNAESTNAKYELRVIRGGDNRAIGSEDGYMPTEYMVLLGEILNVGSGQ
jgi:hypothetical protein